MAKENDSPEKKKSYLCVRRKKNKKRTHNLYDQNDGM